MNDASKQNHSSDRSDELAIQYETWTRADEAKEALHALVSHHPPSLYGHCLRLSFRGKSVYFCGRCTGIYGGLGIGVLFLWLFNVSLQPDWLWFLIALVFGLSTVIDWTTQRMTPRKTRNSVRFVTGFFSGVGLAIVFLLANLFYMLITLAVMVISVGIVGIVESRNRDSEREEQVE